MRKCINCETDTLNTKYCSNKCQALYLSADKIRMWLAGELSGNGVQGAAHFVKRFLFRKYNSCCQECGWNSVNVSTGRVPLEIHHIDSNPYNNELSNIMLLCPNCHALTNNFKSRGGGARSTYRSRSSSIGRAVIL